MTNPLLVGAVVYDPKVVVIWEIIKDYFQQEGCPIDYVFYSNYELMNDALLAGNIQIAWNSPLAWLYLKQRSHNQCRAIAMRDTDRDLESYIIVRKDSGITTLEDLRGKTVATGAIDSPQATLIPLQVLRRQNLLPGRDFTQRRFDLMVGKHGDHIGGELEALRSLQRGESDASCVLNFNWQAWQADGTVDPSKLTVLATTPRFDHCNFSVLESLSREEEEKWLAALFKMSYDNPEHRKMMDLEGLKQWLPGRTEGYAILTEAVEQQHFFEVANAAS
ncbi:MAG TPA: PhnD/SsuA/transferrin family substrate-binding protein [Chloroflexia bacterium]|nr:PhnD/SsuA/transferrin family substrate-binding protein [Chloroflexia bacterium]